MYTAVKSFYLTFYLANISKKCLRNESTSVQETNQRERDPTDSSKQVELGQCGLEGGPLGI
jgi:hypothetical protein